MSTLRTAMVTTVLTALSVAPAWGQTQNDDPAASRERAAAQCRQMSTAELQIACLEAALEAAYRLSGPTSAPQRNPAANTASASSAPSAPARSGFLSRLNPFDSDGQDQAPVGEVAAPAEGLGAEQVNNRQRASRAQRARADATASLSSIVTDTHVHGYASLVVALENGQVWRQLSADTQRIDPDDAMGSPVTIREGRINGYLLELERPGRTIRVERLR
jgi:hypothetical protein